MFYIKALGAEGAGLRMSQAGSGTGPDEEIRRRCGERSPSPQSRFKDGKNRLLLVLRMNDGMNSSLNMDR
jgi:hypothetical protein